MASTPKLGLPLLEASQGQKHLTHNEAITQLDLSVQLAFDEINRDAPPVSPIAGSTFAISATPSGEWLGHELEIAFWADDIWHYITPQTGWLAWDKTDSALRSFNATDWVGYAPTFAEFQNIAKLGVNTTADDTNKLAVRSDAILFTTAANDVRVTANKTVATDTASHVFQTNYSGRAEFGLLGDDDFTLKVSPDNFLSSFEALKVKADSGDVIAPQSMSIGHSADPVSVLHVVGPTGSGATALTVDGDGGGGDKPFRVRDAFGLDKCIILGDGDLQNQNNSYGALSDKKLKTNIQDASSQWADVSAFRLKTYKLKRQVGTAQERTHLGVIAQDLEVSSPGLVSKDAEGQLSVKYSILYLKAIGALQEAMQRIENLEAKVLAPIQLEKSK